ncbi:unnamed protein product, partial [Porites evermanni]
KSFNESWNPKCHGEKHQVQPNSLCSVIEYLSEVSLLRISFSSSSSSSSSSLSSSSPPPQPQSSSSLSPPPPPPLSSSPPPPPPLSSSSSSLPSNRLLSSPPPPSSSSSPPLSSSSASSASPSLSSSSALSSSSSTLSPPPQPRPPSSSSVYLIKKVVEGWCPVLPWRRDFDPFKPPANHTEAVICTDVSGLLEKLKDDRYAWMRIRITETWPQWKEATEQLAATLNVKNRTKKKILLYMGSIEDNFKFFTEAFTGGCLGELTQWSDLMSALYILGHDLIITSDYNDLRNIITQSDSDGCALRELADGLDLIFTDIPGAKKIMLFSGPHSSRYRCKMRILDSFGTDAEFNYPYYKESIPGGRSVWGDVNLLLPQFMTMFPHSPDNSFLGFAVPKKHRRKTREPKNRNSALVYGKLLHFWKGKSLYIEVIRNHVQEVHANIGSKNETVLRKFDVPDFVINHGIVNISTLMDLFQSSKVFVGLGDPLEGPAALEALANGCFFLNPKFDPPFDRVNHGFYAGKPMNRKPMDEKIKTWPLRFSAKENPNMAKALFDWPIVLQYDVKGKYQSTSF